MRKFYHEYNEGWWKEIESLSIYGFDFVEKIKIACCAILKWWQLTLLMMLMRLNIIKNSMDGMLVHSSQDKLQITKWRKIGREGWNKI